MFEIFKDAPAIKWMENDIRKIVQDEENKKTEEIRKRAEEERKKMADDSRQTVLLIISQRFPNLLRPAKAQLRTLKDPAQLQRMTRDLVMAHNNDEAENVLFSLHEDAHEKDTVSTEFIPTPPLEP